MQNVISRLWFLSQGCKQVPLEYTKNIVRWAHPDGYFLNAQGQKVAHGFSPTNQKGHEDGSCYPHLNSKSCHGLMALAFYGDRPTFKDSKTGKEYVGICHHLIPDKLDYRPANLLCWLTRTEHNEADRRQKLLREVVPDGDLHVFDYQYLRTLQDPRVTNRTDFECVLNLIKAQHFHRDGLSFDARMDRDMSHHQEH